MQVYSMRFNRHGIPHKVDVTCSTRKEALRILFSRFPLLNGAGLVVQQRAFS